MDNSLIDEITKRADIVTVVGNYLNLVKKGRIYLAICPFHDDSNPSLQVNPERNTFHCFVDGHGGNAISFVMQYEHLSFIDAVKKVAEIIGFNDPRLHENTFVKKVDSSLTPLINCINDLNLFYEYSLNSLEGKEALEYLLKRNINEDIIKKFHIGYSLNDGTKTIKYLQSKGHSLKTIEDIGIALNKGVLTSDNNHGRVVFPLIDKDNQVVGFSARLFKDDEGSKYVNSPETKLFIKGNLLYNFNNAKDTCKTDQYIYVLEGFMDVIALNKINITSAVALMGTALSKEHIQMLKKLKVEVRLCLDGDLPGQEASMRILPLLQENNIPVRIVNNVNDTRDPDEILNELGEDELKKYLNNLLTPFDFTINFYKSNNKLETSEDKKALINRFLPILISTKSQLEFDDYIFKLSEVTGYSSNAIRKLVISTRENKLKNKDDEVSYVDTSKIISSFHPERKELRRLEKAEREVLFHMLSHDDAIKFYEDQINYFYTSIYREIANFIIDLKSRNNEVNVNNLITDVEMSESANKDKIRKEIDNLITENTHLEYSEKLLGNCKTVIDAEKKIIYKREKIARATEGKTEEEKARVIADSLRIDN